MPTDSRSPAPVAEHRAHHVHPHDDARIDQERRQPCPGRPAQRGHGDWRGSRWRTRRRAVSAATAGVAAVVLLGACGGDGEFMAPTSSTVTSIAAPPSAPVTPSAVDTVASSPTDDVAPPGSGPDAEATGTDTDTDAETGTETGDAAADATVPAPCEEYTDATELPLQRCHSGTLVLAVQLALQAAGHDISALDGEFGDQTDAAVRAFQEAEELAVDGIVGAQTWGAIDFPANVATDANGDGVISPDEVTVG